MNGLSLDYLFDHQGYVLELTWQHLKLSLEAILLGLVIAIPLGIAGARYSALGLPILSVLGVAWKWPQVRRIGELQKEVES